jgi:hypothetical protein
MRPCPQELSWLCEQLPSLNGEGWFAFILGSLIVVFFAVDHYKIPTYAKTTIGEFIELAPESLTSARRYRKGLYIYVALMSGLYLAFCFFWSKGLSAFLAASGLKGTDTNRFDNGQLWPLAAATVVTLVGALGDKNVFGRIETSLRSIAHESAYIPGAVLHLSNALNESFPINAEMAREVGDTDPAWLTQVAGSQDGFIQTWIRAKYLFSRLDLLRDDPEFQQLLSRPENVRAFDFLNEERQNLVDRIAQPGAGKNADLDKPLRKKVESFRSAVSVFLASLLWQGCGNEVCIQRTLTRVKLLIKPGEQYFSWYFVDRLLASLTLATIVACITWFFFDLQWKVSLTGDSWHLLLAYLIFAMVALFATKRREDRLAAGMTDDTFDAALASALWCGLPIGFTAAVTTFAWRQGGLTEFWIMILTALFLAVLVAALFEITMRWAAQSPPTLAASRRLFGQTPVRAQDLRWTLGKAVLLNAGLAFIVVLVLFWGGEATITMLAPKEDLKAGKANVTKVINTIPLLPEGNQNTVAESFRAAPLAQLRSRMEHALTGPAENRANDAAAAESIKSECKNLNDRLSTELRQRLSAESHQALSAALSKGDILLPSCDLNEPVTRELGEDGWLDDFREAMITVAKAVASLERRHEFTPIGTIGAGWPRALASATLWAILTAVFTASVLLYRRSVLWGTIDPKLVDGLTPDLQMPPELWLRTPMDELNNLTPLEAIRYPHLRASLLDHLRARIRS